MKEAKREMKRGGHAGAPRLDGIGMRPLSDGDLDDIHLASLEVLERTGMWVEADDAFDIFADGGCRVDRETRRVRIPAELVEEAIRSTPPIIRWCGRDPKNDIVLGGGRLAFMNFGEAIQINDLTTGENRPTVTADVADICTVVDWCGEIDVYEAAITPRDCHEHVATVHHFANALPHITKPMMFGPLSKIEQQACLDMAAAVVGGHDALRERPITGFGMCSVSPLQLTEQGSDVCLDTARAGLPLSILSMCMAGGSSPQTLAGTLVLHNAEVLAGITLVQLAERGAPVLYSSSTTGMDLRLGAASVGTPETALLNACIGQIAARYSIPCWVAGL
jgi:trimethylamine--corrinoid protein Co-methyltransferase